LTLRNQEISQGLDQANPFNETSGVENVLKGAEDMLSLRVEAVGPKHAAQIWSFMSKFVMLDRLSAVLGTAEIDPGFSVPRKICLPEYLGTGARVTTTFPSRYITLST